MFHRLRTAVLWLLLVVAFALPVFGQLTNVSLEVTPSVTIPISASAPVYGIGGDVALSGTLPFGTTPMYADAAVGYGLIPTSGTLSISLLTGSLGAGVAFQPLDALRVSLGVQAGGYLSVAEGTFGGNPFAGATLRAEWALTPAIRLGLSAGYRYLANFIGGEITPFLSSIQAGMDLAMIPANFSQSGRAPQLDIQPPQFQRVFPVFYRYYNDHDLGSVTITNDENRPITDIAVSFFVDEYMSSPKLCATIPTLERNESVTVPLYALFSDDIIEITESTTCQVEVIVEYTLASSSMEARLGDSLRIQNRNQMTWDDDNKAAAFVTAGDPSVLRFSRNTVAAIRDNDLGYMDDRIKTAMAVFEALRLYGMAYAVDRDSSSYVELSQNESALDYLQFPVQTLDYRAGDCDDLAILYTALLESIGTETAFITIPGHIYSAFRLRMSAEDAERTFASVDDLILIGDEAWLPVETTLINQGFMEAWTIGAREWRENDQRGVAQLYPIHNAWSTYEPTGFTGQAIELDLPPAAEIGLAFETSVDAFVDRELGPQVDDLRTRIAESNNNPRLVNRLGALYARYGRLDDAAAVFESVLTTREYAPSVTNLGNIAFLQGDYDGAIDYYQRALELSPGNASVLVSLARAQFERGDFAGAGAAYREAEIVNPVLAERFAYLVDQPGNAGRADDAVGNDEILWDD